MWVGTYGHKGIPPATPSGSCNLAGTSGPHRVTWAFMSQEKATETFALNSR